MTAATRERLTHITNSLIAFDHEKTEGIFNYPAPAYYPLYKELCPRPVSLLDIRYAPQVHMQPIRTVARLCSQ